MPSLNELLDEIKNLTSRGKTVSCPAEPGVLVGSDTGVALESGDTIGLVTKVAVPKSGILYSATLFDFDDEGTQVDFEIFKRPIADVATDAAFAPTDAEGFGFITELNFTVFDDHGLFQTSELTNIGKGYSAPEGYLYIQAVTRSTPTIAAGVPHRFQLQILSDDPEWIER